MDWFSGITGLAGDVFSSALSYKGASEANRANTALAREQMAFQERMSSTAHQREVADLRAANLNPVLSAKYGGASTPSGAMPTIQNPHANTRIRGIELATAMANNELTKSEARGAKADAEIKEQESRMRTKEPVGKALEWLRLFQNSAGSLVGTVGNLIPQVRAVNALRGAVNSARSYSASRTPSITYSPRRRS